MSTPTTTMQPTPARSPASGVRLARRRARVLLIRNGATVRSALGQSAAYEFTNGEHVIVFNGQRFTGESLAEAISAAKTGSGA